MPVPQGHDPNVPAPERVPRWHVVRFVAVVILNAAIFIWFFSDSGFDGTTLAWLVLVIYLLWQPARDLLAPRRSPAPQPAWSWSLLKAIGIGLAIPMAALSLERVTIHGTPLLAGAALGSVHASASPVAGNAIARPGTHFVVLDAEVRSHLGAPLDFVSSHNFMLDVDGQELKPEWEANRFVPDTCDGASVPRWGSRSCRVVFEVPDTAATARLRIEHGGVRAWSPALDLRALPQADVPRVELVARAGIPQPIRGRPELERIEILVQGTPRSGAAPVVFRRFYLTGPNGEWEAIDYSDRTDLERPCEGRVFTGRTFCVAVFQVPRDATTARLTARTYHRPYPGGEVAAGVATLHF